MEMGVLLHTWQTTWIAAANTYKKSS
jgi:hypothetical protein